MMMSEGVHRFTVGALVRRQARVLLDFHGLEWNEYKGLLESDFVAHGDYEDIKRFIADTRRFG